MSNRVPVGKDLYYLPDTFAFTALGDKDEITLYLSQGFLEEEDGRSLHVAEIDGTGTSIRLPVESARQLFHALGTVLGED